MIPSLTIAIGIVLSLLPDAPQPFHRIGSFTDVRSTDEGEHCGGYSLTLWQSGTAVIGLLDVHEGLCGDPPCGVLQDARLDRTTGELQFWASVGGTRMQFVGRLTGDAVAGTLNGERVRLAKSSYAPGASFAPDQSLEGWCAFWVTVGRCDGVREFCAARGIG